MYLKARKYRKKRAKIGNDRNSKQQEKNKGNVDLTQAMPCGGRQIPVPFLFSQLRPVYLT
jgi:hypothetical protein